MNALQARLQDAAPSIAVAFTDATSDEELCSFRAAGLDIAEIRIDLFSTRDGDEVVRQAQRFTGLPTIATIRSAAEGGRWEASEQERLDLFRRVVSSVDGIDIELSSVEILDDVIKTAREASRVVVVSHHDFAATPSPTRLAEIAAQARQAGADFVKVAAMASSPGDLRTLATFTMERAAEGVCVMAMGTFGPASRVLLPLLGSRVTYAAGPRQIVAGQMSFAETFDALRRFSPEFDQNKTAQLTMPGDA